MLGSYLGERCAHTKRRVSAEGGGIGMTEKDLLREKYNSLNERYWEVVGDHHHNVREDLRDAGEKIQRLRARLERLRARLEQTRAKVRATPSEMR